MQFVSWNCRGLGNPIKAESVKDLMRMVSYDILLLQETNIDEESLLLLSKSKWKMSAGKAVIARGTSGDLATLWCEVNFHLKRWFVTQHWIFTELFHIPSKTIVALFNLYVPINLMENKECWKSLSDFLNVNSPSNVILVGDINITLSLNEKKGGTVGKYYFQDSVEALIQSWDLIDFKPKKADSPSQITELGKPT